MLQIRLEKFKNIILIVSVITLLLFVLPFAIKISSYIYSDYKAGRIKYGDTLISVRKKMSPFFIEREVSELSNQQTASWFKKKCPDDYSIYEYTISLTDDQIHVAYNSEKRVCAIFPSYE